MVGRQPWAGRPRGLDLSHYVAMWFGASHTSSSASLVSTPERGHGDTHK